MKKNRVVTSRVVINQSNKVINIQHINEQLKYLYKG